MAGPKQMSDKHKQAMAEGREQGRMVRNYLEALEQHKPKRGRKRTADTIQKRLAAIEETIDNADPLTRVHLIQERMDLQREIEAMSQSVDLGPLEEGFVAAAKAYSERRGLTYAAWRELGVEAAVLRKAGINRGG